MTLTAPNTELSVTYNSSKAANITKSSTSDGMWVLYVPLKWLIYHLRWWIGVDHAAWIPCMELSPTWFLKNTHTSNIITLLLFSFCSDFNLEATVVKTEEIRGLKQLFALFSLNWEKFFFQSN